jgi:hypothetical protein
MGRSIQRSTRDTKHVSKDHLQAPHPIKTSYLLFTQTTNSMPGLLNEPRIVVGERTESDKWSACDGVEAHKMGTSSVIAIANEEGFLLSNISSDEGREGRVARELCARYSADKRHFGNKPVDVWIVYKRGNSSGPRIRGIMRRIQPARIVGLLTKVLCFAWNWWMVLPWLLCAGRMDMDLLLRSLAMDRFWSLADRGPWSVSRLGLGLGCVLN